VKKVISRFGSTFKDDESMDGCMEYETSEMVLGGSNTRCLHMGEASRVQ